MNLVFYTDKFIPAEFAACAIGPLILIRPKYKDDAGLLAHETVHRKQWLRTFGFHSILYYLSKSYRLKSEVEAYKTQMAYSPGNGPRFARAIATKYKLSVSQQLVLNLLKQE